MAVEATGSRYKRKTGFIIAVFLAAAALYCLYDGWVNQKYIDEHFKNGQADANLMFNRFYFPVIAAIAIVYFLVSSIRLTSKRIVADENGLILSDGNTVAYNAMTHIDKRFFEKEGHFTIGYADGGTEKRLKLSERDYDHLADLLDEIVKKTGAAPVQPEQESSND